MAVAWRVLGRQQCRISCAQAGPKRGVAPKSPAPALPASVLRRYAQLTPGELAALASVMDRPPNTTVEWDSRTNTEFRADVEVSDTVERAAEVPTAAAGSVWVFSYASRMCCETLTRKGVRVQARDPAYVTDPNIRMVFKHRGGQATLEALPVGEQPKFQPPRWGTGQPCVHGVLYRMPASDLRYFQSRDYAMTEMEVETYAGVRVRACVFVSAPLAKLPQEVTPPELYMKQLREGAADNYLDPVYQGWLSSITTVTSAGLGSEYYNTPSRYISYSFLLVALIIVGGYVTQHIA